MNAFPPAHSPPAVKAIGVDLAWSPRNPTAVAVADLDHGRWAITEVAGDLVSNENLADFVAAAADDGPAIVGIDAPLVVPNVAGIRKADALVNTLYRRYHAGVHPANRHSLGRYGGLRAESLVADLEARGFRHDPNIRRRRPARTIFELYPHAALVSLFRLPRILEYKARGRGRPLAYRWREFVRYQTLLRRLGKMDPPMRVGPEWSRARVRGVRGRELKTLEDALDAITSAYVAAYFWTWGTERCAVLGTLEEGYIVTPVDPRIRVPNRRSASSG